LIAASLPAGVGDPLLVAAVVGGLLVLPVPALLFVEPLLEHAVINPMMVPAAQNAATALRRFITEFPFLSAR
jgi:hypothetical protein